MTGDAVGAQPRSIDRRSPVPFFFQLKSLLLEDLERGRWQVGDQIPSEPELCTQYGVSRATVRQALAELEREGRLRKERGRGTFVAEPRSSAWFLQSSHGFFDEASDAGLEVSSKILRREVCGAPGWAAAGLEIEEGDDAILLERVRSLDSEIVMYVQSFLVVEHAELILEAELERASLYGVLESGAGIEVGGGRRVVEATTAQAHLARVLEVDPGSALLYVEATSHDQHSRPFETYRAWHRSDRTKIAVQVVNPGLVAGPSIGDSGLRLES